MDSEEEEEMVEKTYMNTEDHTERQAKKLGNKKAT